MAQQGLIQVPQYIQAAFEKDCSGVPTTSPFYPAPSALNQPIALTPSYTNISTASCNINFVTAPLTTDKWYSQSSSAGPILRIGTNTAVSANVDSSASLLFAANNLCVVEVQLSAQWDILANHDKFYFGYLDPSGYHEFLSSPDIVPILGKTGKAGLYSSYIFFPVSTSSFQVIFRLNTNGAAGTRKGVVLPYFAAKGFQFA
jgi:hypothetical protein